MGLSTSKKKTLLTHQEIFNLCSQNNFLQYIFNKNKNANGSLLIKDLNNIFENKLDSKIVKKLFKICSSSKNKFNYEDFKYLYCLFKTSNYEAKINFIADLVFINKNFLSFEKYNMKVNFIFGQCKILSEKLLSDDFINNMMSNNKITKENFIKNLDTIHKDFFNKFKFVMPNNEDEITNRDDCHNKNMEEKLILSSNNLLCDCVKIKYGIDLKRSETNKKFDKMETEFRKIQKINNGVFPLSHLELILKEININTKLISLICQYFKKKTQKSFLDFQNFKLLISRFSESYEDLIAMIFEIISFPKDIIKDKDLILIIKSFKPGLRSKQIKASFEELQIQKGYIKIDEFKKIFKFISDDIYESLETIQYVPYIFFKLKCEDIITEKNCIEILMKGQKDLTSYIKESIESNLENDFYIVDMKFWNLWCEYTKWSDQDERKNIFQLSSNKFSNLNENLNSTNLSSITYSKEIKPIISTNKIADQNGKIYHGLTYNKDYVIITTKMWLLFKFWYINLGPHLKRSKILRRNDSYNEINKQKNLISEIYEIEIYPIFVKIFNFEDILSKSDKKSFSGMLELLVEIEKLTNLNQTEINSMNNMRYINSTNLFTFSKLTKFKNILSNLELSTKYGSNKFRLWIFYKNKFEVVSLDYTLEEMNITEFAIILFEISKDKKWPSELIEKNKNNLNSYLNNNEDRISLKPSMRNSNNQIHSKISDKSITKNFDDMYIGFTNIGNTCYMNSVLQMLINIPELKNFLLRENILDCINYKNVSGAKGLIIKEFISLFRQKYLNEDNNFNAKKSITPKKFKEIIEKYNSQFEGIHQQDAHDFLNYLIDILHEEINFKSEKENIENPNSNSFNFSSSMNSQEIPVLPLEFWANNLRRNCSFIHSLFLGQLKSSLTCQSCNYEKITYETFTSLSLPIPQKEKIILEIILFRLPFTLKVYYNNYNFNYVSSQNGGHSNLDPRETLKLLRNQSLEINTIGVDDSILSENLNYNINLQQSPYYNKDLIGKIVNPNKANGANYEETKPIQIQGYRNINNMSKQPTIKSISSKQNFLFTEKNSFTSSLITNIPLKIKIEVDRKEKVEKIISMIRNFRDLELEQECKISNNYESFTYNFTDLLVFTQGNFFSTRKNLIIDDCFQNNQIIHIYELLNSRGIDKLFNYSRSLDYYSKENFRELDSSDNPIENFNKKIMGKEENSKNIKYINSEVLIQISHRYPTNKDFYLFNKNSYKKLETYHNVILLSKEDPIKIIHLYDYIWDKFNYFLLNPSKYEKSLWWRLMNNYQLNYYIESNKDLTYSERNNNYYNFQSKINICSPFVLKLIDSKTNTCSTCPWFRFCDGCILDTPQDFLKINFDKEVVLVIEWCSEIIKKEINENNIELILTHPSVNLVDDAQSQRNSKDSNYNIGDCLKLFTEKEELKEDDGIKCDNCKHVSSFYKKYQIQKLPSYLVIVLKRFKYTRMYRNKIDCNIKFPIRDLEMQVYKDYNDCGKLNENYNDENIYDLYSIIYHRGSMTGGHYISIVNHEINEKRIEKNNFETNSSSSNKWIKYDDSFAVEIDEQNIPISNAYILVYKIKDKKSIENNDYYKLINDNLSKFLNINLTEFAKISLKTEVTIELEKFKNNTNIFKNNLLKFNNLQGNGFVSNLPTKFFSLYSDKKTIYVGEPVITIYGRGCVVQNYFYESINYVKIKLKFGYAHLRSESKNFQRESNFIYNRPSKEEEELEEKLILENLKLKKKMSNSSTFTTCKCVIW